MSRHGSACRLLGAVVGAIVGALLLASCASNAPTPPPAGTATAPPAPPAVTPPAPPPAPSPPVSAHSGLLQRAAEARSAGDYEAALALLERAQRIDPDDARVYLGLARTHRAAGDAAMARASAERGLLYCRADSECDALRALLR